MLHLDCESRVRTLEQLIRLAESQVVGWLVLDAPPDQTTTTNESLDVGIDQPITGIGKCISAVIRSYHSTVGVAAGEGGRRIYQSAGVTRQGRHVSRVH
jgi:hypothetical protein